MESPHPLIATNQDLQRVRDLARYSKPGQIYLVAGAQRSVWPATQVIADLLALWGPLRIILGGNRYTLQYLPILLRSRVIDIYQILDRVQISRAETCYQMLDVLQKTLPNNHPLLMMEMLDPFYDEDLSYGEVKGLLGRCISLLRGFSLMAPVFISADPDGERPELIEMLFDCATQVIRIEPNIKLLPNAQPALL